MGGVSFMRGEVPVTWRKDAVDQGRVETLPFFAKQASAQLVGPLMEFSSSWPEIPTLDLGRHEGGSANLAAARWVWQTRDFSSALCSAKLRMCLARNPSLIFKPLCIFLT